MRALRTIIRAWRRRRQTQRLIRVMARYGYTEADVRQLADRLDLFVRAAAAEWASMEKEARKAKHS